jgi:hypothetical protein
VGAEWEPTTPGVLVLPSGRTVRGCALADIGGADSPDFGLHLAATAPPPPSWAWRWIRWRDFRTPPDPVEAREALVDAWDRAGGSRVAVACRGGRGRTGTALACLAVVDGVPADKAVAFVRRCYHPAAVETPWQRRFVQQFRVP